MRKSLIGILLMITLSGCYSTTYFVDSTHKFDGGYSNPKTNDATINAVSYSDEYITIIPKSIDPKIELTLFNNHTSSIRILWDESAYIDISGNAHRVIHTGVKFTDKEKAQVASIVPAGAKIEDVAVPVECIEYINGAWIIIPFEYNKFYNLSDAEDKVCAYKNDPSLSGCTLVLPIMVEDKKIEYTLRFNGDKFSISSKEEFDAEATAEAYIVTLLSSLILPFVIAGLAI